jgi:hypothetical protein
VSEDCFESLHGGGNDTFQVGSETTGTYFEVFLGEIIEQASSTTITPRYRR